MIDRSLFCHFDGILHFKRLTYAACKLIFSLTKSFFNEIFSAVKRRIIFPSFGLKIKIMSSFFHFEINVGFEWSICEKTRLISNVLKAHLCLLMIWYLSNKKYPCNEFLTTKSLMAMLSADLKSKLDSSVLFCRDILYFLSILFCGTHCIFSLDIKRFKSSRLRD